MKQGMRNGVLEILDGGGEFVVVKLGRGTVSWVEKRDIKYTHHKGAIKEVRLGNDEAIEVRFSFNWEWLSGITGVSINEAIMCTAPGWVTTGEECEPDAVNLRLTLETDCGTEIIFFSDFRTETRNPNLREGRVHCKGTATSVIAFISDAGAAGGWAWLPVLPNMNLKTLGSF